MRWNNLLCRMFMFQWPDRQGWRFSVFCLLAFCGLALPFGLWTGLYSWAPTPLSWSLIGFALYLFVIPAALEEVVFRGPLLWSQARKESVPVWLIVVSLSLFIVWHPANTYVFMPEARDLFSDWRFLTVAGALGCAATLLALRTRSLWPPIVFHWLVVVGWKALFGAPDFV
ncbi:MAG: CPBP family glutamic-type intramembrane protease [Pseudomonadota bacterium]